MLLVVLGCAQPKEKLDTVPISGKVTLDGTAVEGAMVTFEPAATGGMAASGKTDSNGVYKLTTRNPEDGALAGSYLVKISKTEGGAASDVIKPGMTDEEATKAVMDAQGAGGPAEATFKELLPEKYKDSATSGFKADVAKGGQTEFNFELTSK